MEGRRSRWKVTAVLLAAALAFSAGSGKALAENNDIQVKYKVGDGLRIGNEDNEIHLQGRVQGRFTYNVLESAPDNDTWAVQRGKIKLEGFTFHKKLKFEFQMNLATRGGNKTAPVCADAGCTTTVNAVTSEGTSGLAELEDFKVDYVPYDFFGIKIGQYKVPFLMQELTSSGKQQFVDRSLATNTFNFKRDIGVDFHGKVFNDRLNYDVFAMNGDGANTINRNQSFIVGTRFEIPILGEYKNSECDLDDSESPNLGVGVAYAFNDLGKAFENNTLAAGTRISSGTFDMGYKYKGFSLQGAAMITRSHNMAKLTNWGYNAQAGYFIVPKHFEVALRGAGSIFSNAVPNVYEYAVALNYFIKGHSLKIQTDYALLLNNRGLNLNDHQFRTQLQVVF